MNSPQKHTKKPLFMEPSKSSVHSKTYAIPEIRFEDQKLTSFSGLTVFQKLFDHLSLKQSLRQCSQPVQGIADDRASIERSASRTTSLAEL